MKKRNMRLEKNLYILAICLAAVGLNACRGSKELTTKEEDAVKKDSLASVLGVSYFKQAIKAFSDKNYDEALSNLRNAEPYILQGSKFNADDRAKLYNAIGKSYFFLSKMDSANQIFLLAQTIDPKNVESYNNLGYVKFIKRDYDGAIADYQQSLAIKSDYQEAVENLKLAEEFKSGKLTWDADALIDNTERLDDAEEKINRYARIVQLQPDFADAKNNLGVALFRAGRKEEAHQIFTQLLEQHPNYAMGYNNLGFIFQSVEKPLEAEAHYLKALECNPKLTLALFNLLTVYLEQGRFENAKKYAEAILAIEPENREAKAQLSLCEERLNPKKAAKKKK
jgi:tetratricopeptide (TPR) repeat protein